MPVHFSLNACPFLYQLMAVERVCMHAVAIMMINLPFPEPSSSRERNVLACNTMGGSRVVHRVPVNPPPPPSFTDLEWQITCYISYL